MMDRLHEVSSENTLDIKPTQEENTQHTKRMVRLNALACNTFGGDKFDLVEAEILSQEGLKELSTKEGLQEMLSAQMLSIHQLQQVSIAMANGLKDISTRQYFSNTAIKLANTFVQQANLLSRLQGNGSQKIVVEHVEVHSGGQAVVGNINRGSCTTDKAEK